MLKVFLVEDEVVMREGIKNNIPWEQEGFSFAGEASDGEMAYPLIQKTRPDILITDIRMPFMDGLELSRLVKQEMPDMKIIVLSGYDEFEYAKEGISIGITDYLVKPVSGAQLLEAVKKVGKLVEEEIRSSDLGVEIKKTYTGSGKGVGKKIYRWTSRHSYLLGDIVRLDGMRYIIWAMDAVFRGGELLFTYKLAEEASIQTPISYNESFTGMSLWGKVEEVRDEKVRVTFDFDPEKGKYFYPWMPETGNASYTVPEVGARVAVYFKDHDEREGIAVRCMVQTERQEKPEEKLLRSLDGSIVMMTDHHLKMQAAEEMMRMMDHSKIDIKGDRIEVDAAGKIRIKAERISLSGALGIRGTAG